MCTEIISIYINKCVLYSPNSNTPRILKYRAFMMEKEIAPHTKQNNLRCIKGYQITQMLEKGEFYNEEDAVWVRVKG